VCSHESGNSSGLKTDRSKEQFNLIAYTSYTVDNKARAWFEPTGKGGIQDSRAVDQNRA
jgi:hypothetical protein